MHFSSSLVVPRLSAPHPDDTLGQGFESLGMIEATFPVCMPVEICHTSRDPEPVTSIADDGKPSCYIPVSVFKGHETCT